MGMITRVRGRLRSFHTIQKLDPELRNEKIAETVCLLSVLFLLPYCSRGHAPLLVSLGGWCVATYSCLVLPVLISANYKYPVRWLRKLFAKIPDYSNFIANLLILKIIAKVFGPLYSIERFFLNIYNLYAFLSQICFFILCAFTFSEFETGEKGNEEYLLIGLKTLLFYSVFTYFTTKTRDIVSSSPNRAPLLYSRDFMEGLCRIVLEWVKAVVVVICLREQGIHFKPSPAYGLVTFAYYLSTEKIFVDMAKNAVQYFEWEIFENCEHLYVPLLLRAHTVTLALAVQLHHAFAQNFNAFALFCWYLLVYLRAKDAYHNYWKVVKLEQQIYDSFRNASRKELDEYDDVCAICLSSMSKAKITPCNHFFHPLCLKECVKNSFLCPICKVQF